MELYGPGWCSELEFDRNATTFVEFLVNLSAFFDQIPDFESQLDSYFNFILDFVCCLYLYAVVWSRLMFLVQIIKTPKFL